MEVEQLAKRPNRIRLQMLLRTEYRTEKGRAEAISAIEKLGLEVTGRGLATISASGSEDQVAAIFGVELATPNRDQHDLSGGELTVPSALGESVERISVAPQHVQMSDATADEAERTETHRKEKA